jgi:7-cyano-7-deazaguanine synthase
MDSCVTAAIAARDYDIAALHASYGQRTEARELRSFHALADYFGAMERMTVQLDYFSKIGGSSLTDARMTVHDADLASHAIPNTYVPFRNAHFLSIATSWAKCSAQRNLYWRGVRRQLGYPDCRRNTTTP